MQKYLLWVALGLVTEIAEDPLARAAELAETLAGHAFIIMCVIKEGFCCFCAEGAGADDTDLVEAAYMSADFREGMEAFLGKRKPTFTGS